MNNKIKVQVFGVKSQAAGGACDCSGGCGPSLTMGEMYSEFETYMKSSQVSDKVEMNFVDVFFDEMDEYKFVIDAMNKGFALPLTAVNGELKFYGGISGQMVEDLVQKTA